MVILAIQFRQHAAKVATDLGRRDADHTNSRIIQHVTPTLRHKNQMDV